MGLVGRDRYAEKIGHLRQCPVVAEYEHNADALSLGKLPKTVPQARLPRAVPPGSGSQESVEAAKVVVRTVLHRRG